ncbi:Sodium/glucose cotransporter [Sinobacterium norvegicum]|uniref:Sodium/glucose cotransporter n=1 Tax=Sinobacterium norvegicum TaxID=1641715 RepID=A0ABN8EH20_9GAMM|nr:sodium:solute symporter family protein [Sinobacterium norvegicum]CAH0990923.1 Sodium/glucose cotransporter [Sinobacterium norvegicum]
MIIIDWLIVAAVLVVILFGGFYAAKKNSDDKEGFFLAGRNMPWWLLGLSMVATTFAADTPNLVTGLVRQYGIAGNWLWWSFLITGLLTTFIYAKLWRRLGVVTDVEFYEVRYSGKIAKLLRGFRAIYLGVFFNVMIMASVTLAAIKIGTVLLGVDAIVVVVIAGLFAVVFSTVGGFLAVLLTDALLFFLAMAGAMIAAYFAVNHPQVGGLQALVSAPELSEKWHFLPDFSDPNQYVPLLLIPLVLQWWSVWYPGSEPGGGGYIAQRMLAAKNERHAVAASAFFNLCHYAVRPWPWILVAMASLLVFPDLESLRVAFPHVPEHLVQQDLAYSAMLSFLPAGILGLVVASIVAAYISTISTSLNWGASYVVNDFYLRFVNPEANSHRQVLIGRISSVLLMIAAGIIALFLESAMQAFQILLSIGAGTGLLFMMRWFWLRINAYSELAAMIASFVITMILQFGPFEALLDWQKLLLTVAFSTAIWVLVTLLTPACEPQCLASFQTKINSKKPEIQHGLMMTLLSLLFIYGVLFTTGYLLMGLYTMAALIMVVAVALPGFIMFFKRT